ncbi:MAG: cell envelope biogenesis protein TolA [Tardiphaga sp.]
MAKKLKTYQTSIGFFDLAIAAPSMKAALEAWGADSNLFHQKFAWEADDPDVVAATLQHPGVVLKRPVGSKGAFTDSAELPRDMTSKDTPKKSAAPEKKQGPKADGAAAKKAAAAYEREQAKREAAERREAATQAKERERRDAAVAKATKALAEAERAHDEAARAIDAEREDIEARARDEDARWETQQAKLKAAVRHAREG